MPRPFEGELIRLRAREESDAPDFHRWMNDWETLKYLGGRYPRSMSFEKKWLTSGDPAYRLAQFIIETRDDRKAIGWLGLHDQTPEDRCAELGIAIGDHEYREGGYGTDTMRTACRVAFDVLNLNRVQLTVYDWNPRAIRVYEKVGFQHEGTLREAVFKAGRWNDLVFMSILRGELQ